MTKKRSYQPKTEFKSKFEEATLDLTNEFLKSKKFRHSLTKGEEREIPIRDFLATNLPKNFEITKGEVYDQFENSSPQLDVMIFDKMKNIEIHSSENSILPAEALLAAVEVKSLLTREEIKKSLKACKKLKSLKPFKSELDNSQGGRAIEDKVNCRYYYTVFAYGSDLSEIDWAKNEFQRIEEVAKEINISSEIIDRIYVVNKGIIHCAKRMGANEEEDSSSTLMYWYMHLLGFIMRENKRRKVVPYLQYAGRMSKGWEKF